MSNGRLLSVTLERFKSFKSNTTLELKPLTVILGRNNSGKSTLIQSLLLLKQTLNNPRPDVSIELEGIIDAFNLRELTHGWPKEAKSVAGPCFTLEWESVVQKKQALEKVKGDLEETVNRTGFRRLQAFGDFEILKTKMRLQSAEIEGVSRINKIELWSSHAPASGDASLLFSEEPVFTLEETQGSWVCRWQRQLATQLVVEVQHFIPYLQVDRRNIGPRHRVRSWHNAYLLLFDQPLADLSKLLGELHFLGSSRQAPSSLNKFATTAPNEIGVSGELAAQLLQKRKKEHVHFLPPLQIDPTGNVTIGDAVVSRPMEDAVNEVMRSLGVDAQLRIEEIKDVGFRLMFGEASMVHVGRGLNSLLPLVELGLLADPLRFSGGPESMSLEDYVKRCKSYSHIALEEPEAHLHPKIASRLAHWLVSLAMTNRCMIVETHSDHLVRRLRGLAARATIGSNLESWLLTNVSIVMVEQQDGCSTIQVSHLTKEGDVQNKWPADFMDEATDEESAIYYAKLEKKDEVPNSHVILSEDAEPELDHEP